MIMVMMIIMIFFIIIIFYCFFEDGGIELSALGLFNFQWPGPG